MFLGIYGIDEYVSIPPVTHRFTTGAAYAPTSLTYSIYEEGNTTGLDEDVDMTPASPFDSITGAYLTRRQLTAAAGFEANKTYLVVVKATVDSVAAIETHLFQVRPLQTGDSYAIVNGDHGLVSIQDDIDSLLADVGDASASTLGSIYAILGNAAATLTSRTPAALTANGNMKASLMEILTTSLTETGPGLITGAFKKFFDKATPTGTINSIPDAVPDANGGLPLTNGTKLNKAVDLADNSLTEMSQGAPPATPTLIQAINYLYRKLRNKNETTVTENKVYDDAGTTVLFKETHSDSEGTFTKGKYGTGA